MNAETSDYQLRPLPLVSDRLPCSSCGQIAAFVASWTERKDWGQGQSVTRFYCEGHAQRFARKFGLAFSERVASTP